MLRKTPKLFAIGALPVVLLSQCAPKQCSVGVEDPGYQAPTTVTWVEDPPYQAASTTMVALPDVTTTTEGSIGVPPMCGQDGNPPCGPKVTIEPPCVRDNLVCDPRDYQCLDGSLVAGPPCDDLDE